MKKVLFLILLLFFAYHTGMIIAPRSGMARDSFSNQPIAGYTFNIVINGAMPSIGHGVSAKVHSFLITTDANGEWRTPFVLQLPKGLFLRFLTNMYPVDESFNRSDFHSSMGLEAYAETFWTRAEEHQAERLKVELSQARQMMIPGIDNAVRICELTSYPFSMLTDLLRETHQSDPLTLHWKKELCTFLLETCPQRTQLLLTLCEG